MASLIGSAVPVLGNGIAHYLSQRANDVAEAKFSKQSSAVKAEFFTLDEHVYLALKKQISMADVLGTRFQNTYSKPIVAAYIDLKSTCASLHTASAIGNVITIAILVALVASGVLSGGLAFALVGTAIAGFALLTLLDLIRRDEYKSAAELAETANTVIAEAQEKKNAAALRDPAVAPSQAAPVPAAPIVATC